METNFTFLKSKLSSNIGFATFYYTIRTMLAPITVTNKVGTKKSSLSLMRQQVDCLNLCLDVVLQHQWADIVSVFLPGQYQGMCTLQTFKLCQKLCGKEVQRVCPNTRAIMASRMTSEICLHSFDCLVYVYQCLLSKQCNNAVSQKFKIY